MALLQKNNHRKERCIHYSMIRQAYCKLNLSLDILGIRPNGYHDLCMVMQTASLYDEVDVSGSSGAFQYQADRSFLRPGEKSLEQRAAEAFFRALGLPLPSLRIQVKKNIPVQAGLGGGSCDAAAALRIFRDCYAPELSDSELERIGLSVGSDVPFCIHGGTCLAEGRGEFLTDLPPLPDCTLLICKPDFSLSTRELFMRADRIVPENRSDTFGMAEALQAGDLYGVAQRLRNAFEEVLLPDEKQDVYYIQNLMLTMGALGCTMSGSGPSVFGIFTRPGDAEYCGKILRQRYNFVCLARPVSREQILRGI